MSRFVTSDAINAYLRTLGRPLRQVAVIPPFDLEVLAVKVGGTKQPAILITAGSHADEVAGVEAAIRLAESLQTEHETWVVPVRDPLGWNGFAWSFSRVTGGRAGWASHQALRADLHAVTQILYEDEAITLGRRGPLAFASVELGPWCSTVVARHLIKTVAAQRGDLQDLRVVIPGNVACAEDRGPFDWGGHTAYISANGFASNLNRFFDRSDAPAEVSGIRALADELRPGLTLDLHEGFSAHYYLFVARDGRPENHEYARIMIDAVKAAGYETSTWDELAPIWGPDVSKRIAQLADGIYSLSDTDGGPRASFGSYCDQYGPSLVTESGMEAPVADRTAMILVGATAVIRAWEAKHN